MSYDILRIHCFHLYDHQLPWKEISHPLTLEKNGSLLILILAQIGQFIMTVFSRLFFPFANSCGEYACNFLIGDLVFQVSCRELKRADHVAFPPKGSKTKDGKNESVPAGLSYIIEIKDAYIPPWVICSICATMGSEGRSFEARYNKIHWLMETVTR